MFGTELRQRRQAAGLSLAELGKLVHYNKSYLSKIKNGLKVASIDLARRCDVALGADGALAALVPHLGTASSQLDASSDNTDDVWMLSLAKSGMNHFMPAGRHVAPSTDIALGFDIPYKDISAAAADDTTAAIFRSIFHECVRLSEVVGTSAAMPTVIAQVHVLQNLASRVHGSARRRLLVLAGRFAEYAGWLAQECGDDRGAMWWSNLSASLGDRAGSADLAAFACARQAEVAFYQEDTVRSVTLAQQAQQDSRVLPRIRGFAALREAQAHALTGSYDRYQHALDKAAIALDADDTATLGGLPLPPFGSSVPGGVMGWCLHDLGRVREATTTLDREVAFIPNSYRHATGRYQVRRVLAYAASGEIDHACTLAHGLLDTASVSSAIIRRDVRDLARTLARWHTHRPVRDLYPRLTAVLYSRPA
jgi:transcriptional regulator with XRE-family HTH domain